MITIDDVREFIREAHSKEASYAYRMGYDCEMNGANKTNCHFSIFSCVENTCAWEAGKKAAFEAKQQSAQQVAQPLG